MPLECEHQRGHRRRHLRVHGGRGRFSNRSRAAPDRLRCHRVACRPRRQRGPVEIRAAPRTSSTVRAHVKQDARTVPAASAVGEGLDAVAPVTARMQRTLNAAAQLCREYAEHWVGAEHVARWALRPRTIKLASGISSWGPSPNPRQPRDRVRSTRGGRGRRPWSRPDPSRRDRAGPIPAELQSHRPHPRRLIAGSADARLWRQNATTSGQAESGNVGRAPVPRT